MSTSLYKPCPSRVATAESEEMKTVSKKGEVENQPPCYIESGPKTNCSSFARSYSDLFLFNYNPISCAHVNVKGMCKANSIWLYNRNIIKINESLLISLRFS